MEASQWSWVVAGAGVGSPTTAGVVQMNVHCSLFQNGIVGFSAGGDLVHRMDSIDSNLTKSYRVTLLKKTRPGMHRQPGKHRILSPSLMGLTKINCNVSSLNAIGMGQKLQ